MSNIEQEKGLNVPLSSVHYFTGGDGYAGVLTSSEEFNALPEDQRIVQPPSELDFLTFCVIIFKSGLTITGESACKNPESFDYEAEKKLAYENAISKLNLR